jgi:hypothetical protein
MAAENVIVRPAVEAGGGFALPSWFNLILSKVRRALLSDEEKRLLHLVEFGASTFGGQLLAAESLDDLEDRLDLLVERHDLVLLNGLMAESMTDRVPERPGRIPEFGPTAKQIFGGGTEELIRQGLTLSVAVADAFARFFGGRAEQVREEAERLRQRPSIASFLRDPSVPAEVGMAVVEGAKAGVCVLAVCAAILAGAPLEPWLGRAIAERWVRAQRNYLRLIASFPGAEVPLDVIPEEERMDLPRLAREVSEAQERFRELGRRALETPGGVYPPHAEPGDD